MKLRNVLTVVACAILGSVGCQSNQQQQSSALPTQQPVVTQPVADTTTNASSGAPGQWGAFNEILRSGGVFKNSSRKYLKLTFEPLGDSMDAIFNDAPAGKVTVTDAKGNRSQASYNLERDRTLTVTTSGQKTKMTFELSQDGRTLSQIGGGHTLKLQQ